MVEPAAKETVIIVHGTWAAPEKDNPESQRWYERDDGSPGGHPFVAKLNAALKERGSPARCWAHCAKGDPIFRWSGDNSWLARTKAAAALMDYVTKLRNEGWRCHIVAHSHGGNVLVEALAPVMTAPKLSKRLHEKFVTLGTPFMDTVSAVAEEIKWRQKAVTETSVILLVLLYAIWLDLISGTTDFFYSYVTPAAIAWGIFVIGVFLYRRRRRQSHDYRVGSRTEQTYWSSEALFWIINTVIIGSLLVVLARAFSPIDNLLSCGSCATQEEWTKLITDILIFVVLVISLRVAYRFRRRRAHAASPTLGLPVEAVRQESPVLLAIGSRIDEAWQILHHLRSVDNPLAVRAGLVGYLSSCLQSGILQRATTERVLGAKSYGDIGNVTKLATALMHLLGVFYVVYVVYAYHNALVRPGLFGTMFVVIGIAIWTPLFVILIGGLTMLLGESFLSAFLSPFRVCFRLLTVLADVPREIGTYLIRSKAWLVLLKMAMGLEGYRFELPQVEQRPRNIPEGLVKYQPMPESVEKRAMVGRSAWVGQHLGNISETFSKLAVTAADITLLLRTVEADQTLVHAAYYTDDECIARIADWIGGSRGAP